VRGFHRRQPVDVVGAIDEVVVSVDSVDGVVVDEDSAEVDDVSSGGQGERADDFTNTGEKLGSCRRASINGVSHFKSSRRAHFWNSGLPALICAYVRRASSHRPRHAYAALI